MPEAGRSRSSTSTALIHITDSFGRDVSVMNDLLGASAGEVNLLIVEALKKLRDYSWNETLPIKRTGIYGDSYLYEFCNDYSLTFKVATDRDEHKQAIVEHYYLKNLLRRP